MAPKQVEKNIVKARCYVTTVVKTLAELKPQMNDAHWAYLQQTPFAYCFEVTGVSQERAILEELVRLYNPDDRTFTLGESRVPFKPEDITVVLGLPCHGVAIDVSSARLQKTEQSPFIQEYLALPCDRNRESVVRNLRQLVTKKGKELSFVKLLVAYLLGLFYFCNTNGTIPIWAIRYVDDITNIGGFAWAPALHNLLMGDIDVAASRIRQREKGAAVPFGYVRGCVAALAVWFYEVTGFGKHKEHGSFPRILNYGEQPRIKSTAKLRKKLANRRVSVLLFRHYITLHP